MANGAESNAGRLQARLTAIELTKEIAAGELEGLQTRASDTAALLVKRSEDIKVLEASGYAMHKEVQALEERLREEETLHHKLWRELKTGFCTKEEETHKLEANAEGLSEEIEATNQARQW